MSHLGTAAWQSGNLGLGEGAHFTYPAMTMIPSFHTPWLLLALENSKQAAQLPVEKQLNNLALAEEAWRSLGKGVPREGSWDLPAEAFE